MKRILTMLLALLMLVSLFACGKPTDEQSDNEGGEDSTPISYSEIVQLNENMVNNGDFGVEQCNWTLYTESGGSGVVDISKGRLRIKPINPGRVEHAVQAYYDGIKLYQYADYVIKFNIQSTMPKSIEFRVQINGGDYHPYIFKKLDLTTEVQEVEIPFSMTEGSDPAPRICFNCGRSNDGSEDDIDYNKQLEIFIDDLSFVCVNAAEVKPFEEPVISDVNVNQVGYRPEDNKVAVVRTSVSDSDITGTEFTVVDMNGNVAYTGKLSAPFDNYVKDAIIYENDYYADFTELTKTGRYKVVSAVGESYYFNIVDIAYKRTMNELLKMFYMQRCGTAIPQKYAGSFAHEVCHNTPARLYETEDEYIDVSGGWHDAGDYGRYVSAGAKAVIDLLMSYETAPESFGDDVGIPESGNSVPDILDEVRYELDWMLKMQDSKTGGVYHKVTCANFPGIVMPEEETEELIVMPPSPTATGDFAAVMARASTIYDEYDPDFAKSCLAAADKANKFLLANPEMKNYSNPIDIVTGAYTDFNSKDERFWAAAELYRATGKDTYHKFIKETAAKTPKTALGWANVGYYGALAYLSIDESKTDADIRELLLKELVMAANRYIEGCETDGYKISLGKSFFWGSNMTVANNAVLLMEVNKYRPNEKYVSYARDHIDYIYGMNPMGTSYVTGAGEVYPISTHHRPSQYLEESMPGMLVGGPNANLEDPLAKSVLAEAAPAMCYVDNEQSFSCNEITIYWNSALYLAMCELGLNE